MAKKIEKITWRILDDELQEYLEKKPSLENTDELYRKSDSAITADDLDEDLRTIILNIGEMPDGYNDTELRSRIINLENVKVNESVLSDYFKKDEDLVFIDMLSQDLYELITNISKEGLITKDQADELYRKISDKIIENDLSNELKEKINRLASGENNIPQEVLDTLEELKNKDIQLTDLIDNIFVQFSTFRTKDTKITINDLSSAIATIIENARSKQVKITESDLTTELQQKIAKADSILDTEAVEIMFLSLEDKIFSGQNGSLLFSSGTNVNKIINDWIIKTGVFCATEQESAFAQKHFQEYYDLSDSNGVYYYKEDGEWTNVQDSFYENEFTNRLLVNPYFGTCYICTPEYSYPILLNREKMQVKLEKTFEPNGMLEIDARLLFGEMIDCEDVEIRVKLFDNDMSSRSYNHWINSEAAITVVRERTTPESTSAIITLYNDTSEEQTCSIVLDGYKSGIL